MPENHLSPEERIAKAEIPGKKSPGMHAFYRGKVETALKCSINSLDDLDIDFISPPIEDDSMVYRGRRTASFVGPVGEIAELIEEPR